MKSVITIAAVFAILSATAQTPSNSFTIKGFVKGVPSGIATLTYTSNNHPITEKSQFKHGNFLFKGKLDEPQEVNIEFTKNNWSGHINFFAENSSITIKADTANLSNIEVQGSTSQNDFELYKRQIASNDKKNEELNKNGPYSG